MRLADVECAITAVVHLSTQPPHVLQQVTLRPEKCAAGLIRLGETPGDEALCWIALEHVEIVHVLGRAIEVSKTEWKVEPIMEKAA